MTEQNDKFLEDCFSAVGISTFNSAALRTIVKNIVAQEVSRSKAETLRQQNQRMRKVNQSLKELLED